MAEIPFERLMAAIEATRGTAAGAPTHLIHLGGTVKPVKSVRRPVERRGTLARNYRSVVTRRGNEWETEEEAIDTNIAPFILNTVVAGNVTSPTTPGGATNARLWTFLRSITADDIEALTLWFGDPNVQTFRAAYCMADELSITSDASDEEGVVVFTLKGMGGQVTRVSNPTVPASIAGVMLPSQMMEVFIDTNPANIGTTALVTRVISVEHTIPTGVTYKHTGGGATSTMDHSHTGREQTSPTTKLVLEMPDTDEYELFENHTLLACRVRHNGALIEAGFNHFLEVDIYGEFETLEWGENQGSNRTLEVTITGQVDPTLGTDLAMRVQNARTGL